MPTDTLSPADLMKLRTLAVDEGHHIAHVPISKVLLRRVLTQLERTTVCPRCETTKPFDLIAHESHPSRANPLAAAAALNMRKAAAPE
jgi:hypothetical protein